MNKYLVAVADFEDHPRCWIEQIWATSYSDCQEKLMDKLIEDFDISESFNSYKEFVKGMVEYNICIGTIEEDEV